MDSQLLASIAIVAALALVGAAVVSNLPIFPQQAFADCPKHGSGWDNAKKNCNKPPRNE